MSTPMDRGIKRVHVIFKTHLDVGFTDFSANVISNYFRSYIPKAIELAEELRKNESQSRFTWTTGSWLIYEYLEQAETKERKHMERAILQGDITWHALPFTVHSENMGPSLFQYGLSLSQRLDQRFGKKTISAKMTDVPGHTRGIIPLRANSGVQFLHIGVNGASTPPDVPDVFTWQSPDGSSIVVMYHKGSYGDLMVIPGMEDAIAFAHTGDNLGPQSAEELLKTYHEMQTRLPHCELQASTMDAFAVRLMQIKEKLPVISQEIGDTWIHGAGTDPQKETNFRELSRIRQEWLAQGIPASQLEHFSRKLIMVPEHTWGLDVKTHLNDWVNYSPESFNAHRGQPNFQKMERSWQEQRQFLTDAVAQLPENLRSQAQARLASLKPQIPCRDEYSSVDDFAKPIQMGDCTIQIDPQTGMLTGFETPGTKLASPGHPLGKIWYEAFSADDYQHFYRQYNVNKRQTRFWAIPDFTKPGIEECAPEHKSFLPELIWAGSHSDQARHTLLLWLDMPEEAWKKYGAPRHFSLEITINQLQNRANFRLQWFDKPACRLPEALWLSFHPRVRRPGCWLIEKMGQWISPFDVIRDGNRHLHAVGENGALYKDGNLRVQIQTLDTALLAPGKPSLLDFNNRQPDLKQGLHFNLFNNLWGTNFPMWYEDDALFRFILNY